MRNKSRFWTWYQAIVISLLLSCLLTLHVINYRIRNIDNPKEVHIMVPGMNSSATEISCDR